ncbi:hypothetical protein [Pseudoxanthomonas spadix]|nr:hypothetical protein [Pseudoxanthomonas spadix]
MLLNSGMHRFTRRFISVRAVTLWIPGKQHPAKAIPAFIEGGHRWRHPPAFSGSTLMRSIMQSILSWVTQRTRGDGHIRVRFAMSAPTTCS